MKSNRPFYIYELRTVGLEINKVYYGSTQQKYPYERIATHFRDYKRFKRLNTGFCYSFKLIQEMDNENVTVVCNILDYVPCEEGLRTEGRYMIQAIDDETIECVNHNIPGRTGEEYYQANKEKKKHYYQANKEKILKYQKEYYKTYNKEKTKHYYQANKEKIREYQKEYRKTYIKKINFKTPKQKKSGVRGRRP